MSDKPLREVTHQRYKRDRKCPGCGDVQMFLISLVESEGWLCRSDDCNRFDEYERPETTIDGEEMCQCGRGPVADYHPLDDLCLECLSEIFVPPP